MKPFLFSYYHNDKHWSVTLYADDWADANALAKKLCLTLDGELMGSVPVGLGWFAKLKCWLMNSRT